MLRTGTVCSTTTLTVLMTREMRAKRRVTLALVLLSKLVIIPGVMKVPLGKKWDGFG